MIFTILQYRDLLTAILCKDYLSEGDFSPADYFKEDCYKNDYLNEVNFNSVEYFKKDCYKDAKGEMSNNCGRDVLEDNKKAPVDGSRALM